MAADFLGVSVHAVRLVGAIAGDIPAWSFQAEGKSGSCTLRVTKAGGKVMAMLHPRPVGEVSLSHEEGGACAKVFLEKRGYTDLAENYYSEAEGTLTVNFTATENQVLLYPDLIKVEVALDNGEIVGFEGENYLTHHISRGVEKLKAGISKEEAGKKVSSALAMKNIRLALIPTPGEEEVLCWECTCRTQEGRRCMVYINGATGAEEQILLLLEDETGTLVQ